MVKRQTFKQVKRQKNGNGQNAKNESSQNTKKFKLAKHIFFNGKRQICYNSQKAKINVIFFNSQNAKKV